MVRSCSRSSGGGRRGGRDHRPCRPGTKVPAGPVGRCSCRLRRAPTLVTFTSVRTVKERRRGASRISAKHQVTIPAEALRAAGLAVGERLVAHAEGPGRIVFEREEDVLAEYAGALTGAFEPDELARLRDEWD